MQTTYVPPSEDEIRRIVREAKLVAVVGMKDETKRNEPAFSVPETMHARGIEIIPMNPTIPSALSVPSLPSVAGLTRSVDVLQIFRRTDAIAALTGEILALPPSVTPKVVWMQTGIADEISAARLAAAGVVVVMDRCFAVEMARAGRR